MEASYIRVTAAFSQRMRGKQAARLNTDGAVVTYTDGPANDGDIVCAAWLKDFFEEDFATLPNTDPIIIDATNFE